MGCGLGWGEGRSHGPEAQRSIGLVAAQGRRGQVTEARAEKQVGSEPTLAEEFGHGQLESLGGLSDEV